MSSVILDSDEIARCIIFDKAFSHDVHIDEHLWIFGQSDEHGKSHESALLVRLAQEPEMLHAMGCHIAAVQNTFRNDPVPGPKRRYYCGYRLARFGDLPKAGDGYTIEISLQPENGLEAHLDVALTIHVSGKSARRTRKTDAGLALAEQFGAPVPHVCKCDEADTFHPINQWGEKCLFGSDTSRWGGALFNCEHGQADNDLAPPRIS